MPEPDRPAPLPILLPDGTRVWLRNGVIHRDDAPAVEAPERNAGKTLLLGVDAIVDGTQAAGATATPKFTVTVVYQ